MTNINDAITTATNLIVKYEGFHATPYQDGAGIWTIGYGFTYIHGQHVAPYMPAITLDQAKAILKTQLTPLVNDIAQHLPDATSNQLAALSDFAYNLGLHTLFNSTLWHFLINHQDINAAHEFTKWDKVHSDQGYVVEAGLQRRRNEEKALFMTGLTHANTTTT